MKIQEDIITQQNGPDKLIGVAAILQSIPLPFVYWCLTLGTFGLAFILWVFSAYLALMAKIVFWLGVSFVSARIGLFVFNKVHYVRRNNAQTRAVEEQSYQERLASQRMLVSIETGMAKLRMHQQLPEIGLAAIAQGRNFEYGGLKVSHHLSNLHSLQSGTTQIEQIEAPSLPLPTYVRYEDIRSQVPQGHVLIGVGTNGIETRDSAIGACVWIVGLSGTGKTSTTVVRVEERVTEGHSFLGVDPHWFKPDSLTNAISGYVDHFLQPMARDSKETLEVLNQFLDTFKGRKSGKLA
jgi:hypothetical protein